MNDRPALAGADVLVTGGAGFIGSHLVRRLVAEGAVVRVLEHPAAPTTRLEALAERVTLVRVDFTEPAATTRVMAALEPAVVFHLAGWTGGRSAGGDPMPGAAASA
jgi:UDP-glucose 4-epimerase